MPFDGKDAESIVAAIEAGRYSMAPQVPCKGPAATGGAGLQQLHVVPQAAPWALQGASLPALWGEPVSWDQRFALQAVTEPCAHACSDSTVAPTVVQLWDGISRAAQDLVGSLLQTDPAQRPTAQQARGVGRACGLGCGRAGARWALFCRRARFFP